MATGMTAAQARVLSRFNNLIEEGAEVELVELTKDGSDEVRYGIVVDGALTAIVLSKEFPEDDYNVSALGENDSE